MQKDLDASGFRTPLIQIDGVSPGSSSIHMYTTTFEAMVMSQGPFLSAATPRVLFNMENPVFDTRVIFSLSKGLPVIRSL